MSNRNNDRRPNHGDFLQYLLDDDDNDKNDLRFLLLIAGYVIHRDEARRIARREAATANKNTIFVLNGIYM